MTKSIHLLEGGDHSSCSHFPWVSMQQSEGRMHLELISGSAGFTQANLYFHNFVSW